MGALAVWAAISAILALIGGALFGPLGALGALGLAVLYLAVFAWLPRAAHRAFARGEYRSAAKYFAVAGWVRLTASARRAARLSRCACELGAGNWQEGLRQIEAMPQAKLGPTELAVWKNNVAYALARLEVRTLEAVSLAEAALEARPSLPGFIHTRAIALLSAGQIESAIAALEAAHTGERDDDSFEAERCYDLGRAWSKKGEDDYACDYFHRARRACPASPWGQRAGDELAARDAAPLAPPTEGIV